MIKKFLFSFLILFLTLILVYLSLLVAETYLKYVGLGDPVIYEKNNAFGYTLLPNQNKVRFNKSEVNDFEPWPKKGFSDMNFKEYFQIPNLEISKFSYPKLVKFIQIPLGRIFNKKSPICNLNKEADK